MSREDVGARLGRVLAMVPWIAAQVDGATVEELAARFEAPVSRIEKDLRLLGEVEPEAHSNVTMFEEEGRWYVDTYTHLARPFRITADDAFGLIAAAQSILQVPGVDESVALHSALAKVARALGGDVSGLEILLPRPAWLDDLQRAAQNAERLKIEYFSASRDEVTRRTVDPLALFTVEGHWHMAAYCHIAKEDRDFRVDRVRSVTPTGETFEHRATTLRTDVAFDPAEDQGFTVRMAVQPEQRWAIERYPVRDVKVMADGTTQFTIDVVGDAWFERLLLRLGPTAEVVDPADKRAGARVAAELLELYAAQ